MQRWKLTALAAAAVTSLGLHATDASALALGRITVQSALGEPLRAEVELPEVTSAEAETLRTSVATPDGYRARGVEYNSAVTGVRVNLERRGNGRSVLTLRSDRPVNEPFVDLILEASWAAGKVVRNYTLLFDPPASRQQPATVTVAPQISAPAAAAPVRPPRPAQRPDPVTAPPAVTSTPSTAAAPAPAPSGSSSAQSSTTVRSGDTAGRIAAANKPANVSLDQMLVAMLRANPGAFVNGNVNRIRAGAVIEIPDEAAASNTTPEAARQFIVAQSRDFNDFRRKLASNAPSAQVAGADRSARGAVGVQVEEGKAASTPDRLTLSKGAVKGTANDAAAAEKIAQERQARASEERRIELDKNIRELEALKASPAASAAATATAPNAATPAASAVLPGVPVAVLPTVPTPGASAAVPDTAVPTPTVAASAAPLATTPASAAATAPDAAPAPAAAEEPGVFDGIADNPLLPLLGGTLLALLLGLGIYKAVQRRRAGQVDSSFLESRLQPDSFFGASGGQRVDTNHEASSSSMAYSPSQLDAGGDVDPVAEADVYLAYGRDLQAEEILKEALRTTPNRVAIHVKLLEIYAKRGDDKTFESVASEAFRVTRGEGPEWDRICEMGRTIDPSNRLYQPGGQPALDADGDTAHSGLSVAIGGSMAAAAAAAAASSDEEEDDDLGPISADDLDLDLDEPSEQPSDALEYEAAPIADATPVVPDAAPVTTDAFFTPEPPAADDGLDFTLDEPSFDGAATAPGALDDGLENAPRQPEPEMLDFDVDSLSFDLHSGSPMDTSAPAAVAEPAVELTPDDPLATKLALAEEFNAIGDADGARALAEEVLQEASGDLKARAERLLAEMG